MLPDPLSVSCIICFCFRQTAFPVFFCFSQQQLFLLSQTIFMEMIALHSRVLVSITIRSQLLCQVKSNQQVVNRNSIHSVNCRLTPHKQRRLFIEEGSTERLLYKSPYIKTFQGTDLVTHGLVKSPQSS